MVVPDGEETEVMQSSGTTAAGEGLEAYAKQYKNPCWLGCLIRYNALTAGFLGDGPVTWLYTWYVLDGVEKEVMQIQGRGWGGGSCDQA